MYRGRKTVHPETKYGIASWNGKESYCHLYQATEIQTFLSHHSKTVSKCAPQLMIFLMALHLFINEILVAGMRKTDI